MAAFVESIQAVAETIAAPAAATNLSLCTAASLFLPVGLQHAFDEGVSEVLEGYAHALADDATALDFAFLVDFRFFVPPLIAASRAALGSRGA